MKKDHKSDRLNEAEVKLAIGDWLARMKFKIFDENPNRDRPKWGVFTVENVGKSRKPDLVVRGKLKAANETIKNAYIAIEIKRGYKHHDILDGFDDILDYFSDYLSGAEYYINGRYIEIAAFVFATLFSIDGYLFKEENKFSPYNIVKGPWDSYPMTFTISRLLWRQKDNIVKRYRLLCGIPKIEKKLLGNLYTWRQIPEIGVIVKELHDKKSVRLMLSKNPYHWRFLGK